MTEVRVPPRKRLCAAVPGILVWGAAAALVVFGLTVRCYVLWRGPVRTPDSLNRYEPLAESLLRGHGFTTSMNPPFVPSTFDQPAYPLLLAISRPLPFADGRSIVAVQLGLEILILLLASRIALAASGSRAASRTVLVLGWSCPFLALAAGNVETEVLATLAATLTAGALLLTVVHPTPRRWAWAGAAAGLALLTRADLVVAVTLMIAAALFESWRRRAPRLPKAAAIVFISMTGVLLPWAIRNAVATGTFQPLGGVASQAGTGYALWLGTWLDDYHLQRPYWWFVLGPKGATDFPSDKIPDEEERRQALAALTLARDRGSLRGAEVDARFRQLASQAWSTRPLHGFLLTPLTRAVNTWVGVPSIVGYEPFLSITRWAWVLVLAWAALGAARSVVLAMPGSLVLLGLGLGRSLLPLVSGLASEPRYMFEALPVCLVMCAIELVSIGNPTPSAYPEDIQLDPSTVSDPRSPSL
jgi:Dolichyl-phosphate-mannose-protein mannosyltransferase